MNYKRLLYASNLTYLVNTEIELYPYIKETSIEDYWLFWDPFDLVPLKTTLFSLADSPEVETYNIKNAISVIVHLEDCSS
jgi:hypothetical protein